MLDSQLFPSFYSNVIAGTMYGRCAIVWLHVTIARAAKGTVSMSCVNGLSKSYSSIIQVAYARQYLLEVAALYEEVQWTPEDLPIGRNRRLQFKFRHSRMFFHDVLGSWPGF